MLPREGRPLRCAIYTRKSSEEGLEQDFNSLHAQREACEAYIKSQKHEGWTCLPHAYDDGGISGGTMDRPALQQLLADIKAGKVDTVVVYKVDRLTRSLADFAKIVEIFDAQGVSFVSVTQQFNTTTSMGRLTLNVLLSFAQFEREVTGERIRDKIAASKKKGMWMGGVPPLGYDIKDRKLVVNETEAATVRHIFERYMELGSVRLLKHELDADGIVSKIRQTKGVHQGGKSMQRGALYHLLRNRLYLGEISHKGEAYPGEHPAIVDRGLWERAQLLLEDHAVDRKNGTDFDHPSLLAGLIFDTAGNRMVPSHAVKSGRRFRYYISRPLITGEQRRPATLRVPAQEIEQVVSIRLRALLADQSALFEMAKGCSVQDCREVIERGAELTKTWSTFSTHQMLKMLRQVVARVEVGREQVTMAIMPIGLLQMLLGGEPPAAAADPLVLIVPVRAIRGIGTKLVIEGSFRPRSDPDPAMVRLIVRAHRLQQTIFKNKEKTMTELAAEARMVKSYYTRVARLAWLAPDIIQSILIGTHPPTLNAEQLMKGDALPMDWAEQRSALGFV